MKRKKKQELQESSLNKKRGRRGVTARTLPSQARKEKKRGGPAFSDMEKKRGLEHPSG